MAGDPAREDVVEAGDEEMAEADSSGDSSDSDSDFEEVDISEEDSRLLMKLEQQLQDNPNLYDSHVQYIELLRRCKLTSRLREARQAMHAAFPLTEALWFDWLSDEIEGVADADDIPRIEALLEAAVKDYLSIPLWVQFLEFVRDFNPEVQAGGAEGQAKMRDLCERALTAGGLHVTEGSRLWAVYRAYEQSLAEEHPSDEQTERLRSLWVRQLQVPLSDGPITLTAYQAWEQAQPGGDSWQLPKAVQQGYDKAQQAAGLRQPYEESVAAGKEADAALLAAYMAYIKVEEQQGDPARVQIVYERALAAFPVTHYLWAQYARYLEAHLKINSVVNAVYARAVRNCPWVGQLWGRALRALERSGAPEEQQEALYGRALVAGLQTYEDFLEPVLARLDSLRRRGAEALPALRAAFRQASDLLHSYFPNHLDRTFRLTSYWADSEAGVGGDLPAARAVWEAAVKGASGRYADTWAAFINFERQRGHIKEARSLYKRCYSRRLEEGGQVLLCEAWLRFEREEGSAEDHLAACLKVEPILQELQAVAAAVTDPHQHAAAKSAADKAPKLSREEMRALRQQADPNFGKRKQKQRQDGAPEAAGKAEGGGGGGEMLPPPPKKPRTAAAKEDAPAAAGGAPEAEAAAQEQRQQPVAAAAAAAAAAGAEPAQPAGQQEQQGQQGQQDQEQQGQQGQQGHDGQQQRGGGHKFGQIEWRQHRRTEANTAFVKHLAEGVDEAAVKELFGGCGQITGVEMGRDKATGRLKGFAYVHFASPEGLEAACRLDRADFRGKHIFVAPSKPPGAAGGAGGQPQGDHQQHNQQQQQHGGRGGGRGGRDGGGFGGRGGGRGWDGGGRGGRDGGGRFGRGGGRGGRGGHRSMIDLGSSEGGSGGEASHALLRGFVPRSAALHGKQGGGGGAGSGAAAPPAGDGAPKSNEEFRKMFLAKK